MDHEFVSVFSVDPGGTTGWKWALVNTRSPSLSLRACAGTERMLGGQIDGNEDAQVLRLVAYWSSACKRADRLARALGGANKPSHHLLYESFSLGMLSSDASLLSPVRINAKLELMLAMEQFDPMPDVVESYSPSDAKSTITDDRLERWGLAHNPPTPWRHENDACRHLALHLRKLG
jgi:hypothetical protein